jgi:hypothetical protein
MPLRRNEGEGDDPDTDTTSQVEVIASSVVIPDFERRAHEARQSADPDAIQEVQEEYHEARLSRARRRIKRESREGGE